MTLTRIYYVVGVLALAFSVLAIVVVMSIADYQKGTGPPASSSPSSSFPVTSPETEAAPVSTEPQAPVAPPRSEEPPAPDDVLPSEPEHGAGPPAEDMDTAAPDTEADVIRSTIFRSYSNFEKFKYNWPLIGSKVATLLAPSIVYSAIYYLKHDNVTPTSVLSVPCSFFMAVTFIMSILSFYGKANDQAISFLICFSVFFIIDIVLKSIMSAKHLQKKGGLFLAGMFIGPFIFPGTIVKPSDPVMAIHMTFYIIVILSVIFAHIEVPFFKQVADMVGKGRLYFSLLATFFLGNIILCGYYVIASYVPPWSQ